MSEWAARLRWALSVGLAPDTFWRLSLKEWRMLTAEAAGPAPMSRREFEALEAWHDGRR